jgi:pentose-5-phosphate-3-epimerase
MVQAAAATVDIQVAGSIKRQQVPHLVKAGATSLAMGSGIYKAPNMAHEVVQMRALAENLGDQ